MKEISESQTIDDRVNTTDKQDDDRPKMIEGVDDEDDRKDNLITLSDIFRGTILTT